MTTPADPPLPGIQLPTLELNGRTHWPEMTDLVVVGPGTVEAKRTRMTTAHLSQLIDALPQETSDALALLYADKARASDRRADELHALLESERSEHAKTRAIIGQLQAGAMRLELDRATTAEAERDALAPKLAPLAAWLDDFGPLVVQLLEPLPYEPRQFGAMQRLDAILRERGAAQLDRDGRRLETAGKEGTE